MLKQFGRHGVWLGAILVLLSLVGKTRAGAVAAACSYPILSLSEVTQRAPNAVLASVIREQPDGSGGFSSVLKISGLIKGRPLSPVITINGLGHPAEDCNGAPRLQRGNRFVLFLSREGQDANTIWSVVDAVGGVYQLTSAGVRFPPDQPGGQPQQVALTPADFVRNVGIISGADPARIEDLVNSNGLLYSLDRGSSLPAEHHSLFDRLPRRETSLAIAAAAVLVASLTYLFWRPAGPRFSRRP